MAFAPVQAVRIISPIVVVYQIIMYTMKVSKNHVRLKCLVKAKENDRPCARYVRSIFTVDTTLSRSWLLILHIDIYLINDSIVYSPTSLTLCDHFMTRFNFVTKTAQIHTLNVVYAWKSEVPIILIYDNIWYYLYIYIYYINDSHIMNTCVCYNHKWTRRPINL